jgi:hypothetical protein
MPGWVTPELRCPEFNKKEGVCYAVSNDGVELPIVDVTHPAFELCMTPERQQRLVATFLEQQRRFARRPAWLRSLMSRFALRGSTIAQGLRRAEGTFLDGMTTYLFKLGPRNLGSYAVAVDRQIASSLPGISVRLRLRDMARLLADALAPRLAGDASRPVHFMNIAGGPALDSLNALILLSREQPASLHGRRVVVRVLDGDTHGPAFGARALAALGESDAPLAGLDVSFHHITYDWRSAGGLAQAVEDARREGAITIGSSEGGLFEYGSDEAIVSNLQALSRVGDEFKMVGSVTRNDETMKTLKLTSTAATLPRGLDAFAALASRAGFRVAQAIERPLSDQVVLERCRP